MSEDQKDALINCLQDALAKLEHGYNAVDSVILLPGEVGILFRLLTDQVGMQLDGRSYPAFNPKDLLDDMIYAPKNGQRILVIDEVGGEAYITSWTDDAYTAQGGKGGPSGWFSGKYADHWGDRPNMDEPIKFYPLFTPFLNS